MFQSLEQSLKKITPKEIVGLTIGATLETGFGLICSGLVWLAHTTLNSQVPMIIMRPEISHATDETIRWMTTAAYLALAIMSIPTGIYTAYKLDMLSHSPSPATVA